MYRIVELCIYGKKRTAIKPKKMIIVLKNKTIYFKEKAEIASILCIGERAVQLDCSNSFCVWGAHTLYMNAKNAQMGHICTGYLYYELKK